MQWGLFLHQQLVSTQGQDLGLDPPPQIQGSFYSFVLPGLQGPPAGSAKAIRKELTLSDPKTDGGHATRRWDSRGWGTPVGTEVGKG